MSGLVQAPFDVIVIGLGVHGSSTVRSLAQRGYKVLGLESAPRDSLQHGSSHGLSRVIRTSYFEDPSYVPLVQRSFEMWRDLESADDAVGSLLTMTGSVMIGSPACDILRLTLESLEMHHLQYQVLSAEEVAVKYNNTLRLQPDEVGIFEENAGVLYPEKCIAALQRSAEKTGNATLLFQRRMESYHENEDGSLRVMTKKTTANDGAFATASEDEDALELDEEVFVANKLVLCLGAWTCHILGKALLDVVPLTVERKVLFWFEPEPEPEPEPDDPFHSDNFPVYIWDCGDKGAFYGFPRGEKGLKVAMHYANGVSTAQDACTPQTIDRTVADSEVDLIRESLSQRIPAVAKGSLQDTATCMYTMTNDTHFLLDFHPSHAEGKNVIVASPCSGHGFKMGPVIGEILADLAVQGETKHNISLFSCRGRI